MSLIDLESLDLATLPSLPLGQRASLPNIVAIYFVLDAERLLYVGRATFLRQRWYQHHRLDAFLPLPQVHIAWLAIANHADLALLESQCIAYFKPIYNGIQPSATHGEIPAIAYPPRPFARTIGARVLQCREALGWTQQELATRTHMPQTLISRLERGVNKNPGAVTLKHVATALHVSIDWLVGMYDETPDASPYLMGAASSP
jgi:hypothetical protein